MAGPHHSVIENAAQRQHITNKQKITLFRTTGYIEAVTLNKGLLNT